MPRASKAASSVYQSHVFPQMRALFSWTLCFAEDWRGAILSVLGVGHRALPHRGPCSTAPPGAVRPRTQPGAWLRWGLGCQEERSALLQATLSPPHPSPAQAFVCTPWEENNPLASHHTWIQPPICHLEKWANSLTLLWGLKPGWMQLILTALIRWRVSKGRPHLLEKLEKKERREERQQAKRERKGEKERKKWMYSLETKKGNNKHLMAVPRRAARNSPFHAGTGQKRLPGEGLRSGQGGGTRGLRGGRRANAFPCFWPCCGCWSLGKPLLQKSRQRCCCCYSWECAGSEKCPENTLKSSYAASDRQTNKKNLQ